MTLAYDEFDDGLLAPAGGTAFAAEQQAVIDLLARYSTETTPGHAARIPSYAALLSPGRQVNVTFLPGSNFADTVETARRLKREGLRPVPHFAARSIPSLGALDEMLGRLQAEVGIDEVLAIGGGVDRPVGTLHSTMQMLESRLFERHGIRRIGIAGHPEGTPDIPADTVAQALADKQAYARAIGSELYIVTQFCFEATPVIEWSLRLARQGIDLPIQVGIPGPATIKALLNYARLCGIGNSVRVLRRQAHSITKLMTVSAPVRLVTELALYKAQHPDSAIAGVHVYPLGGLGRLTQWLDAIQAGAFEMNPDLSGFTLTRPTPLA